MAGESTHRYAGMGRDQVLRMTAGMRQNFANVGLPYAFTDQGLVANTMDAHRVLAWCGSPEAQDKAVEVIFRGYFAEERAPNDRELLIEACVAAGKSEADARAFLDDKTAMRDQVQRELSEARGVRGVPHFVIRQPGKDPVQISGAQPPASVLWYTVTLVHVSPKGMPSTSTAPFLVSATAMSITPLLFASKMIISTS